MSQNDFNISDGTGAAVLADLNSALQALASTSKGPAAPTSPYAGQLWLEDDNPSGTVWTLWQYDGTDWIKLGEVDSTNNKFNVMTNQSADVASTGTLVLDTAYGLITDVTGTSTITAVTLAQGRFRMVRFTGALTLTHGANLVLPTGANITTAAGDYAILAGYASSVVRCVGYFRADGTAVGGGQAAAGSVTRNMTTASGTQSVTGLGFKPKAVHLLVGDGSGIGGYHCTGFSDGVSNQCLYRDVATGNSGIGGNAVAWVTSQGGGNYQLGNVTMTATGFDIAWVKTGSPTGTGTIAYIAMR